MRLQIGSAVAVPDGGHARSSLSIARGEAMNRGPPLFVSSPDLELPQSADLPRRPLGAEASRPSLAQVTANR